MGRVKLGNPNAQRNNNVKQNKHEQEFSSEFKANHAAEASRAKHANKNNDIAAEYAAKFNVAPQK